MTAEQGRPDGFPLSEDELREIRRFRLEDLLHGRMTSSYSEWLLKGSLGNQTKPEAIIAVFPTPVKGGLAFELDGLTPQGVSMEDYCREAVQLIIPRRVRALERHQYRGLGGTLGPSILETMIPYLTSEILPTVGVLFSAPSQGSERVAFLISPRLVPPVAAFAHLRTALPPYAFQSPN